MQLDWVRAFLAVVDHGGFHAAAVELYRSQGRISSYVAALERELGAQLFDREHRPARLTAAGEVFVPHARAMVEEVQTGKAAVAGVQGLLTGDVALATYPSAGASFVPEVLRRFSREHPGIRVELVEAAVRGIDSALDQGVAQLAIRPALPPPMNRQGFEHTPLWREPMCLVVPEGHPLCASGTARLPDLQGTEMVVSGHNLRYDTEVFRLLEGSGIDVKIRFLSDQPQILVGLVRSGLAIGLTNRLAVDSVRTEGVVVVGLDPPLYREVGAFWAPGLSRSPAAKALLETVRRTPAPSNVTDLRTEAP
ncbi:LysR family transcriptional regulator [Blastococcus sp. TF02A-26]|uniref:LysR family transcriptional regulator n=1 Tax=Blastococcus sp. TF02A-26 TaxID=2250577 RepID=UPI001314150C|nr:LysR family transcriptional regulator [Blastococcus sp. TF02A-26]